MTKKLYRWGIIGLGGIAYGFASTFKQRISQLAAITSQALTKAKQLAADYSTPKTYGSYKELLADGTIDVVHITVPNKQHAEHILKALQTGRHVLREKAITVNAVELEKALAVVEKNDLVLAEAITIFNMPPYGELRRLIDAGKFGQLKMIQAPFESYRELNPKNRFFNPDLAGGILLDIDTYAVSFARWFLGLQPDVLASSMVPFSTGADRQPVTLPRNRENELATISLTLQAKMSKQGAVAFKGAYITIADYPRADKAIAHYNGDTVEIIISGYSAEAISYEIYNMVKAIRGTQPNHSLFFATEVIDIPDQMQKLWQN